MTIKKIFATSIILINVIVFTKAQEEFHYNFGSGQSGGANSGTAYTGVQAGLNASLTLPLNDSFRQIISSGIGANVQLKYMIDGKFTIGAYGGYNLLASRTPSIGVTNTLLQYGGSLEYFLFPGSSPYFGIDLGNFTFSQNISGTAVGTSNSFTYSKSSFGIGPNIGYAINLTPSMQLNTNLKYNHVFTSIITNYQVPTQFLQITVGLIFNLSYRPAATDE